LFLLVFIFFRGSAATSSDTRPCSLRLYSTTGGQTEGEFSEPTLAQPVKQIITIPRTAAGGMEHLAVDGMGSLQVIDPLCGASGALALAAEVEGKEGDGERCEGVTRRLPRPMAG
jgi:hypothetical protein